MTGPHLTSIVTQCHFGGIRSDSPLRSIGEGQATETEEISLSPMSPRFPPAASGPFRTHLSWPRGSRCPGEREARGGTPEGGAGPAAPDRGAAGRVGGGGGAAPGGGGPAEAEGPGADAGAADPGRDHLPGADRLPVEPAARGVSGRQHGAPAVPAVGRGRGVRAAVGGAGGAVRGPGRGRLGGEIGRAHVGTPVTPISRMPSSA